MYVQTQTHSSTKTQKLRRVAGDWLRSLREKKGLSQKDMARLVGIEYYSFISQIETGRGRVPSCKYVIWAEVLGVPASLLAKKLMKYYDPETYIILFPAEEEDEV
ncbi:helix-turn-helix domain-containing protein [Teichococcus vastitatis]|uniref:Helix-turn-helix domain-containing protein n=1 Tax=Teichococcus vastitatis TaxID=2307076 RepID=A0ABS9W8V5_9PROT|nr:helix-turn-helix transcriptional regulator [Pseudoroseomonas vastitatis]MCI0755729.1 helix-turn-helix domain-containing protein [Pseudoroseomonas vastitatis]